MSAILSFESVDSGYGNSHVLHGVSFAIDPGQSVAILGRNGVGKTSVVNTFLGIARHRGGEIRFHGKPARSIRPYSASRQGISVVVQGRGILPNLSVRENIILGGATRRPGRWTVRAVFDLFPVLEERADTPGTALSGGQQQMLAIGRALMANPDLLVLDEPSEGLAPVIVDEVAGILNRLLEDGTAVLLIEQNLSLVERVAHSYHVLSKGSVVDHGTLENTSIEELQKHIAI
jgi:branched-chain amino acid transport system ATP-binding protein